MLSTKSLKNSKQDIDLDNLDELDKLDDLDILDCSSYFQNIYDKIVKKEDNIDKLN